MVGIQNFSFQSLGQGFGQYHLPNGFTACLKLRDVGDIVSLHHRVDARAETVLAQQQFVRITRRGKSRRHPHAALGEMAHHFTQIGVFPADFSDIADTDLFKKT